MTADRSIAVETEGADPATRRRAVALARAWIGTPYCHQASLRRAGCDCLGLIRGIWRGLYGIEPEAPPPYTPAWGETDGAETLLAAAGRHLIRLDPTRASLGDLLVFRMRNGGPAKHIGLLSSPWLEPGRLIHAYAGHGVCETHLGAAWLRRLAGAYRFPAHPGGHD
ncbi:MAG: NlpC/P60 family protein [Pseudomonadota bacterium]